METKKKCEKCSKSAGYRLVDKLYCARCFSELVEQKIKKHLRGYSIRRDSRLLVRDKASEYMVKKVINLPVALVGRGKADFTVLPWTLDDENEDFFSALFKGKSVPADRGKTIKLFYPLSRSELKEYFRLKKVRYKPKDTEITRLLDRLEKTRPGTKTSLLRSQERIRQIIQ